MNICISFFYCFTGIGPDLGQNNALNLTQGRAKQAAVIDLTADDSESNESTTPRLIPRATQSARTTEYSSSSSATLPPPDFEQDDGRAMVLRRLSRERYSEKREVVEEKILKYE